MFRSLFRRGKAAPVVPETQRTVVVRALGEVNEVLSGLESRHTITIEPLSGTISIQLPEQMPDEALSLPAPEADEASPKDAPSQTKAPEKSSASSDRPASA